MKLIRIAVILALAGAFTSGMGHACGDKFLIVDGTTTQDRVQEVLAANIVIFARADASQIESLDLVVGLRESGHRVQVATDEDELGRRLVGTDVDVVLANYPEALVIASAVSERSPRSRVVPILTREDRRNMTEARSMFGYVLNVPTRITRVLDVIQRALQAT